MDGEDVCGVLGVALATKYKRGEDWVDEEGEENKETHLCKDGNVELAQLKCESLIRPIGQRIYVIGSR